MPKPTPTKEPAKQKAPPPAKKHHREESDERVVDVMKGAAKAKQRAKSEGEATLTHMRNRIVGHDTISPFLVKPHRLNFRTHPESQMKALKGSMDDLGWMRDVLVSKRTGIIIDGHARVEEAKRRKVFIPVCYLDLSPEEENKALALLDPISEMAGRNDALFMELLGTFDTKNEEVAAALEKMAPLKDGGMDALAKVETSTDILTFNTDVFLPSTNIWGIPDLRDDRLYDGDAPLTTWPSPDAKGAPQMYIFGEGGFDERVTDRILCFYTEDWRFERVWNENVETLAKILPLKPRSFTIPDFSLWGDDPLAVQLYNLYRARWIARYWQEAGMLCIPSLATSTNEECLKFAYDGFVKRPSLMSMQLRAGGKATMTTQHMDSFKRVLSTLIERVAPERLVFYASPTTEGKMKDYLPGGTKYIWCTDFSCAWFDNGQKMKAEKMARNMGISKEEAEQRIALERAPKGKKKKGK